MLQHSHCPFNVESADEGNSRCLKVFSDSDVVDCFSLHTFWRMCVGVHLSVCVSVLVCVYPCVRICVYQCIHVCACAYVSMCVMCMHNYEGVHVLFLGITFDQNNFIK